MPVEHHLALVPTGVSTTNTTYVAESAQLRDVLRRAERLAALRWPVLVTGESGTGKEGIARALHFRGRRAARPFVTADCGALPRHLVEAELFGHERGAFTDAVAMRPGLFESASGGTLFLDEVGELPVEAQAALLRVVETGEVRRIGASVAWRVDVRLVAATNRDLGAMVQAGTFRRDLYYRLAGVTLVVPPLRERPADIVALVTHFLDGISAEVGPREISDAAVDRLLAHDWPGNARELRHVLCAAALDTTAIDARDVAAVMAAAGGTAATSLLGAVRDAGGNVTAAAKSLGMARSTLRDRLRRVGL